MSENAELITTMEKDLKRLLITREDLVELISSEESKIKPILTKMFDFMMLSHTIHTEQMVINLSSMESLREWDTAHKDVMGILMARIIPVLRAWDDEKEFRQSQT